MGILLLEPPTVALYSDSSWVCTIQKCGSVGPGLGKQMLWKARKGGRTPSKRELPFIMHVSLPESTLLGHYGKGAKTLKQCAVLGEFSVTECMFRLIFHYGTFIFVIYYYASFNPCSELQITWNRTKYLWMWHMICAHLRIKCQPRVRHYC